MATESSRPTPLGVARARFVDGLARKSAELRGSLALLAATPGEERPREELRRRLHALYASAQVFQLEALAGALKDGIARLDAARDARATVAQADLDALASLAATLPLLGAQAPVSDPEIVIVPASPKVPTAPPPERNTQPGLAPPVPPPPPPQATEAAPLPLVTPKRERTISRPPLDAQSLRIGERPSQPTPEPAAARAGQPGTGDALQGALAGSILNQRTPPRSARPPVVSVLVLDTASTQASARSLLPSERFEILGAADPEEALRLARSSAPDVVLADLATLTARPDFVGRLRDDPLTDFVPVVALADEGELDPVKARELGAADVLTRPLDPKTLEPLLVRLGLGDGPRDGRGLGGDLTIEEIATRVAEEIRRGLVEAADDGRQLAVPVGDGAEILAATWAAIGRMRAHLAVRSGGRVHFREKGSGPAFLALTDEDGQAEGTVEVSLRERRVVVVDDDPAVVWFFAGLLREAGCVVEEATDGAEALKLARKTRPDAVISDILMPEVDGFALLREMQRDPVLSDVPVILLSWKEDFLQRMRELQSGASGYLKKEAGSAQILAAVRDVLRPRARLEARLKAGGEVRGRLSRIGPIALLKTVAQLRPDARVTVRDAWNLFEIEVRGGNLVDVTRTAADGSFSRGAKVVPSLLGALEGRFTVSDEDAPVRGSVKEPLDALLARSAALLGGVVHAVSGTQIALAHKIELDADVLASVTRASPAHVVDVVKLLEEGHGPRALLVEGRVAPQVLEGVLVDLARQGAIVGVTGEGGEDRIELARRERGETALPTRSPSIAPPAARSDAPQRAPAGGTTPGLAGLTLDALATKPGTVVAPDDDEPQIEARPASEPELSAEGEEGGEPEESEPAEAAPASAEPEKAAEAAMASAEPAKAEPAEAAKAEAAEVEPAEPAKAAEPAEPAEPAKAAEPRPEPAKTERKPRLKDTAIVKEKVPAPTATARPSPGPAPAAGMGPAMPILIGIGVLFGVGYFGYQALSGPSTVEPVAAGEPDVPAPAVVVAPEVAPDVPEVPEPAAALARAFGVEVPGIDAASVPVAEGEGVLLFEGGSGAVRARITHEDGSAEGDVLLASDEVTLVVPAGIYGVAFEDAGGTTMRFTRVAAGSTRRLPRP